MDIEIGRTYLVEIDDCCVKGEFTSKLLKAQMYTEDENHNDVPYPVTKIEYGTEAFFENGVRLELMNGTTLTEVEVNEGGTTNV